MHGLYVPFLDARHFCNRQGRGKGARQVKRRLFNIFIINDRRGRGRKDYDIP